MKFVCSVSVNLPREKVVELWSNPANLKEWQDGFVKMEALSGTPGTVGAKSMLYFQTGKRSMELEETIQVANLPEEFTALFEHQHMVNTMTNRFVEVSPQVTRWDAEIHYLEFRGFVPKAMARVFPGMFRKQTQKWLDQFKVFAEGQA